MSVWAAEAPAGNGWVATLITLVGVLGGAGGLAALTATVLQRKKIKADAADVITDTALTLVEPLRARVTELETEVSGTRRQVADTRENLEAANGELREMRTTVREMTALMLSWRDEIMQTVHAPDPAAALERLRVMVSTERRGVNGQGPN